MDVQMLANFTHLIDQYNRAKEVKRDKLLALDATTCTLHIQVFNEQTGLGEWRFLGNLPLAAIDEVIAAKKAEVCSIEALKIAMQEMVKG